MPRIDRVGLRAGHDRAAPRARWVDAFSLRSSAVKHRIVRRCRRLTTASRPRAFLDGGGDARGTRRKAGRRSNHGPGAWAPRTVFRFCVVYFGLFCLTFAQITFAYAGVVGRRAAEPGRRHLAAGGTPTAHRTVRSSRSSALYAVLTPVSWQRRPGRDLGVRRVSLSDGGGAGDRRVVGAGPTAVGSTRGWRRGSRCSCACASAVRCCSTVSRSSFRRRCRQPASLGRVDRTVRKPESDGGAVAAGRYLPPVRNGAGSRRGARRGAAVRSEDGDARGVGEPGRDGTDLPVEHDLRRAGQDPVVPPGVDQLGTPVRASHAARRLAHVVVLRGPWRGPRAATRSCSSRRDANRSWAGVGQALLGVWVLVGCVVLGLQTWREFGDGRAKPDLYGIWQVAEFSVDGNPASPTVDRRHPLAERSYSTSPVF